MSDEPIDDSRGLRRGKAFLLALLALVLLTGGLLLDLSPSVPERPRPTAQDIAATQDAYTALRTGKSSEVRLDEHALEGLAALLRDASNLRHLSLRATGDVLDAEASLPVLPGVWLNLSAKTQGDQRGFPEIQCAAGAISPPSPVCRWMAERARDLVRRRGGELPPLDTLVRRISIEDGAMLVALDPSTGGGLIDKLAASRRTEGDVPAIRRAYCALARQERRAPAKTLDVAVQRAFAGKQAWDEARTRDTFVALAVFTVGEQAERLLLSDPGFPGKGCRRVSPGLTLHNRADLAQHWTLSAGLTAAFGSSAATDLGEWKELRDSLPAGSGFSFVDLAADRSGVAYARRAIEGRQAAQVATELRSASEGGLVPPRLLAGPEGLTDGQFAKRFKALDAPSYKLAVAVIDRELSGGPTS